MRKTKQLIFATLVLLTLGLVAKSTYAWFDINLFTGGLGTFLVVAFCVIVGVIVYFKVVHPRVDYSKLKSKISKQTSKLKSNVKK